jgi:hypothetical protein
MRKINCFIPAQVEQMYQYRYQQAQTRNKE